MKVTKFTHACVRFTAAGFTVTALGGRHATIHGGQPDCANLGYLVDDRLYHPGDSLHLPDRPVRPCSARPRRPGSS